MTLYNPLKFGKTIAFMLQNVEYQPKPYIAWLLRIHNFDKVVHRRQLMPTKAARLFSLFVFMGILLQYIVAIVFFIGFARDYLLLTGVIALLYALALVLSAPYVWALLVCVPLFAARFLISRPKEKRLIGASKTIFSNFHGIKIAVAGSYGKTTMKEILGVVLAEGKRVAITPANKNVASSHAIFAQKLVGNEDVLIVEFGEGAPGDVAGFTETLQPTIGVITGLAPAHLDHYKSIDQAARDIFSLSDFLQGSPVYVNGESVLTEKYVQKGNYCYTSKGVGSYQASDIKITPLGMQFKLISKLHTMTYELSTQLVGRHLIGSLSAAVSIAEKVGLNKQQIISGISKTGPFEHRMQPRQLASGAWLIDDTYNGTVEGIRAGTALLAELPARRKIYVTPGLVDQGQENEPVHVLIGEYIAKANPDIVVLMKNTVTGYIQKGMQKAAYQGDLRIETDPLQFYQNVEQFVATGDIILMQNDWTDNYA